MVQIARSLPAILATMVLMGGAASAQREAARIPDYYPVFDIPRLSGITVDGKQDDWKDQGFQVNALAPVNGGLKDTRDQDDRFRLGWDEKGLLVLATVQDNTATESPNRNEFWMKDSVEIFLGAQRGVRNWLQAIIAPGIDSSTPELRYTLADNRSRSLRSAALTVTIARTKTADGYIVEALIPWENLKITPVVGKEAAFQIIFNDVDGDSPRTNRMWFPEDGTAGNPAQMHRIRLAEKASPAQNVAILPNYNRFPRTKLQLFAPANMAGQSVEALQRAGRRVYGKTTLRAQGGWAVGEIAIEQPLTPPLPVVELLAGRELVGAIGLREPEGLRRTVMEQAAIRFSPAVFSTQLFPSCDFSEPERIEQLIGSYRIETAFYDASGNPVTVASKPGRYGAIVTVTPEKGDAFKRFLTLYRMDAPLDGERDISATLILPAKVGIDQKVLDSQKPAVNSMIGSLLARAAETDSELAVYLAGLAEAKPDDPAVGRNTPWARDQRYWTLLKAKTGNLTQYKYLSYTPKNYETDKDAKFPLVLFLHGAGERGEDVNVVRVHGPLKLVGQGKEFPFVIIAPQCPRNGWWSAVQLGLLLDEVQQKYRIDPDRVYVTGLSMGGFGTWALALEYPDRFAAIAPICGGGDPYDAMRLKSMPIWAFHGGRDNVVPIRLTQEMVGALKQVGNDAKFTIYPEARHDSWTQAYNTPELYTWLLDHRRTKP